MEMVLAVTQESTGRGAMRIGQESSLLLEHWVPAQLVELELA